MLKKPTSLTGSPEGSGEAYIANVRLCLNEIAGQNVGAVAEAIYQAHSKGGEVYILGNGGSAATASHMACDFSKTAFFPGRRPIKATCLTDNIPLLTAIGNDLGFDAIFEYQLNGPLRPIDIVICISASGNSPNVIKAAAYAKNVGSRVIAFTGFGGGKLKALADICINVSCREYGPVEDTHLVLDHMITAMLRDRIESGLH